MSLNILGHRGAETLSTDPNSMLASSIPVIIPRYFFVILFLFFLSV
ncbi:hypothetical protein JI735_06045 [Paenibacillus sonchi]|uniref:Uncharacterized protein n=1 Tax=Paenibacillus sonchi TaxID=373687 RepID=A0A974PE50_9BACL|nr:hypothetical protein [Paenibacillus sonchi]QQZ62195.1 hypothetical protein JI735_06045 [Paenibacillus sonchi]